MHPLRQRDFRLIQRLRTPNRLPTRPPSVPRCGAALATKFEFQRSVPFPRFLADDLAAVMVGKRREDLVFSAPKGGVLRLSHFRPRMFGPAVDRLVVTLSEFPRVTPHDLRHTAASLAISGGANPKAVQMMLGHQSAALTLDTYADLFPDDLELVSAALDQARQAMLAATADQLRTGTEQSP